jgi:diguanylate cyclase (GGDEF)-like protein
MSTSTPVVAELVPIADRIRWMLGCRALLVAVLFFVWVVSSGSHTSMPPVVWFGIVWLSLSTLLSVTVLRPARREPGGRRTAVIGFTAGLLGDGLLLAAACHDFGGLDGPIGYLIVLHGVAVTLLASFRTGAKLALWHSILALMLIEAVAAGVLRPAPGVAMTSAQVALYLTILWAVVLATASLAAVNERELRRRRYDSEVLRQFGLGVADEQDVPAIALRLARFGSDELLASRAVVIVQPCDDGDPVPGGGHAIIVERDAVGATPLVTRTPADVMGGGVLRHALDERETALVARLDPQRDAWLSGILPDARNLVVVPFALQQVIGAVVVEHPRRSSQRRSQRAERRTVSTTEQATAHASMAIGRAVLVERIRAAADIDGLTRVANRRRFDTVLAQSVEAGAGFGLVMIDLDHFKGLNDRYGHQTGDEVLGQAAAAITAACRDGDLAARYGGEEFAVILGATDAAGAAEAAERIRQSIRNADTPVPVTASLGVAAYPVHAGTAGELVAAADAALYAAKAGGRDQVKAASAEVVNAGVMAPGSGLSRPVRH